jgi:spore coat protein U-like protein
MNKQLIAKLALIALAAGTVAAHAAIATSSFQVQMTITSSCAVTTAPTNINLGSVAAASTAVNQNGSTTFKVNCSKNTPFYVGLAPSAANGGTNAGTGAMSGTGSNTDTVPYTLYSNAGLTTVWGNTATSSSVGNGMSGTGAGMAAAKAVSFTAYAKAVNADFTPDTYTDTVTVNVNY